jgi:RHS repeat-associated protein
MNTFRRFSRRAWLLHGYLLASMILWPVPTVRSYWTWDTATGAKVTVTDPPLTLEEIDAVTGQPKTIPNPWWEQDSDTDGLTNAQEVTFLSDPYNRDSDHDGLTDTDERDITPAMLGGLTTTDPWNWDSNVNGYSDHDEYWAWQSGLTLNVNYANLTPPSPLPPDYYRDIDGDGTYNLWDYAPTDGGVTSPPPPGPSTTDSDWDGHVDASDSHPYTNWLWEDWNYNGTNDSQDYYYWYPSDSDSDGYADSNDSDPYASWLWEDWNRNGTNDSQEPPPTSPEPDDDNDTYPNSSDSDPSNAYLWEDWNRNGHNDSSEPPDSDGDGIVDDLEYSAGTNPWFHDSDGDGLSDSEERTAQTNPLHVDTDGDGLTDHEEIFIFQKNPLLARSQPGQQQADYHQVNLTDGDLDGIPDLIEAWYGRDPSSNADASSDLDLDGRTDFEAYLSGWSFTVSFTTYDQDRDGITDAREAYWGLNPYDPGDATQDADHDGLLNIEEIRLDLNLFSASTHGTPDLEYANTTWNLGWQPCLSPGSLATTLDDDTDGDGMSDAWEHRHRLNLRDPSDAIRDPDKDTLSNLTEYRFQSHPRIPKTQDNTHDRTRLYATGSPLNASTAGGLMNRYRAQMAAELASTQTLSRFFGVDVPPASSMQPLDTTFQYRTSGGDWTLGSSSLATFSFEDAWSEVADPTPCTCPTIGGNPQGSGCCRQGSMLCPGGGSGSSTCGCTFSLGGTIFHPSSSQASTVTFKVKVRFPSPRSRFKSFVVKSDGVFVEGFNIFPEPNPPCEVVFQTKAYGAPMKVRTEHGGSGWGIISIEEVPVDDDAPDSPPLTFSSYDSAGSRYRKVGLNGLPLADQKPQGQDETGEREEETYVDAYTRQLSHSVTDIYSNAPGSLIPLAVRRDVSSDTWNLRNGLRITERNDLPFGPCWRTNVCSYVRFEINSDKPTCTATVVDEQGGATRFLSAGYGSPWEHTNEEFTNAKSAASELIGWPLMMNFTLKKKFGTTCHYESVIPRSIAYTGLLGYAIDHDRISGSDEMSYHIFARLSWVQDRLGNRLIYEYPDADTLTPSRIYDPDRSGRQITFENDLLGRVVKARGPSGETVTYEYQGTNGGLSRVTHGSGSVQYMYEEFQERDENYWRWGGAENPIFHQNLTSIIDELGRPYTFQYTVDQDITYDTFSAGRVERRIQLGMPRRVAVVDGPAGLVSFTGSRKIHAGWPSQANWPAGGGASGLADSVYPEATASTSVSGPAGNVTYQFSAPVVKMPDLQNLTMERRANPLSFNFGVFYTTLSVNRLPVPAQNDPFAFAGAVVESYRFDPDSSGALIEATDASGNVTTFTNDVPYDDPLIETRFLADGTKVEKKFNYDPLTREMISMTDPMGVRTEYALDHSHTKTTSSGVLPVFGLKTSEKTYDAANNLLRETRYTYDHPVFAGMVTKQWSISPNESVMPSSVVETALAPASDDLGPNPGWWCEVTQRTGTATSGGGLAAAMTSTTTISDLSGRKRTVIDPLGRLTNFAYDDDGRLSRVDHPDASFKTLDYDAHGNLVAETNENGVTTFHTYDNLNRRIKTTIDLNGNGVADPVYTIAASTPAANNSQPSYNGDIVTTTTYNVFNQPVDVMDARGTLTRHGYDGLGRLTSKTVGQLVPNPNGGLPPTLNGITTSYFYDGLNNGGSLFDVSGFKPNRTIDPVGTQTTVLYDKLYRPVSSSVLYKSGRMKNLPPSVPEAYAAKDAAEAARLAAQEVWREARAAEMVAARKNMSPGQLQNVLNDLQSDIDDAYDAYNNLPQPGDIAALEAAYQAADSVYQQALQDQTDYQAANSTNGEYDPIVGAALAAAVASAGSALSAASNALGEAEGRASALEAAMLQIQSMESGRDEVAGLMPIVVEAATNSTLKTALQAEHAAAKAAVDAAAAVLAAADKTLSEANYTLSEAQAVAAGTYIPDEYIPAVTLTEYDLNGKPTKVTDPLGRVTLNEYDALGNLIKVTEPDLTTNTADNPTVRTYYTHHGKPWKVIDQMGNETITTYDALGRAVQVKAPPVNGQDGQAVQAITTTEYDAAGNVIAVTDPLGRVVETVYDERNRPTHVYAPTMWDAVSGQFVRPYAVTTYDALGQPTSVTDHTGATTTTHYDRAGRKWKVEAPSLPVSSSPSLSIRPTTLTTFDPGGLPLTVTNPLNQTITNTYDIHGRLTSTLDAEGITNTFEYDAAGNRTKVIDGKNQTTTFAYDGLNRLIQQTFANGDTWTHGYNAVQKLAQISPRGITTSYAYDARDRLLTVTASGMEGGIAFPPTSRSYTYDNAGKLLTVTESGTGLQPVLPGSANVSYTYDAMGRVTAESSQGQVHHYEYDLAGNRVKATYSTGRIVETSYDGLNRPEAIVDGDRLTRYGYDKAGRAVILIAANGQTSSNTYDALGRLTDRVLYKTPAMDPAQRLAQFKWQHDLLGNVTQQEEIWPGEATRASELRRTTMAYDDNNRLTSETIWTFYETWDEATTTTYTYDDANNRSTKTVTGGTEPGHWDYTYNTANQLTAWEHLDYPGGSVLRSASLTYDDAGNRTSQAVTQISGTYNPTYNPQPAVSGLTTYTWDAQDRLASVTLPDGSVHRYEYDYRTRRTSTGVRTPSSANETRTAIVFSGGLSVAEYESTVSVNSPPSTLSSTPTVEYTRGPDMGGGVGGLLYTSRRDTNSPGLPVSSSPSLRYNLSNGRGDIVAQSDQYASLTWTASYEAYGKRTKETGENKDKQRGNSKDEDPTGLLNEGFRYRDIETGVWLSRDPAGFVDGPNLYAYVRQNPWTMFDAQGLYAEAGHFYTTYAVAVAAGMDKGQAYRTAYYSQLPDEAHQLDAIAQATNATSKVGHPAVQMWRYLTGDKAGTAAANEAVNDMTNVHRNLHFLRGSDDAGIKESRSNLSGAIKNGEFASDWERGFAIHTLGDTYAHTKNMGNGKEAGYDTLSGHGEDGLRPDSIAENTFNSAKYESYVRELYTSLGGKDFDKNADMQALLKNAKDLGGVGMVRQSHDGPNNKMHDWFVDHFKDRAPMNGYDPRKDGATDSSLPTPSGEDVKKHLRNTNKHLK